MIVKFLRPATTFKGVGYSFAKMLLDKGEMMQVKNFEALSGLSNPRPEDYVNYLEAVTRQSKRIVYPQLHVTLSAKGREQSKDELTEIAGKWLQGMGYGNQPYLIVFHKDTKNNHVHMVSTRIGRDGKKIKDSYEHIKAYQVLNNILGLDETQQVKKDITGALNYRFSSRAQFMMLLEVKGYSLRIKDDQYLINKFGKQQDSVLLADVDRQIGQYQLNKDRLIQLRAIVEKYRPDYNPELVEEKSKLAGGGEGKVTGCTSELADHLQQKFGLQIFFHAKNGKQPYGYTIIDHSKSAVYKGGDLMPLAEFIKPVSATNIENKHRKSSPVFDDSALNITDDPQLSFSEESGDYSYPESVSESYNLFIDYTSPGIYVPILRIDISDDIDDEQINGRNRRRKRKARTNTR